MFEHPPHPRCFSISWVLRYGGELKFNCFFVTGLLVFRERYTTDNNIMGAMCAQGFASVKCEFIPYHTISNWRWKNNNLKPALMQFDSLILPGTLGKLERYSWIVAKYKNRGTFSECIRSEQSLYIQMVHVWSWSQPMCLHWSFSMKHCPTSYFPLVFISST